jgi:hypothetical protein
MMMMMMMTMMMIVVKMNNDNECNRKWNTMADGRLWIMPLGGCRGRAEFTLQLLAEM